MTRSRSAKSRAGEMAALGAQVQAGEQAARARRPVRRAEPGQRGHEDHAAHVRHRLEEREAHDAGDQHGTQHCLRYHLVWFVGFLGQVAGRLEAHGRVRAALVGVYASPIRGWKATWTRP
jgi:hypothetical protein